MKKLESVRKDGKEEAKTQETKSKLKGEKNEKSIPKLKVREALGFFSLCKFSIFSSLFSISIPISISKFQKNQYQYQNQYFGDANFNINIEINILNL